MTSRNGLARLVEPIRLGKMENQGLLPLVLLSVQIRSKSFEPIRTGGKTANQGLLPLAQLLVQIQLDSVGKMKNLGLLSLVQLMVQIRSKSFEPAGRWKIRIYCPWFKTIGSKSVKMVPTDSNRFVAKHNHSSNWLAISAKIRHASVSLSVLSASSTSPERIDPLNDE